MLQKLKPYWKALPNIFCYQILTKAIIMVWIIVLREAFYLLLKGTGRVALTSGDFVFLFQSWQGILILALGLVSLYIYAALDLNAKVALSRQLVCGGAERVSITKCLKEGLDAPRRMTCLRGIGVVLYIALIAPLLGFGVSFSLTKGLYIPTFIASAIKDSTILLVLFIVVMLSFLALGVANLFILHGVVLDRLPVKEASAQSRQLVGGNWKDYFKQNVLLLGVIVVGLAAVIAVAILIPLALISVLPLSAGVSRVLTILFVIGGTCLSALADLFGIPLYLMKMTQLFYTYKQGEPYEYRIRPSREHPYVKVGVGLAIALLVAMVILVDLNFDKVFPLESNVKVIAHRGGGSEGAENTLAGFETAWKAGAYGSETDIQRTKDGYYILNHDKNFKRVAGDKRAPEEMTLEEIQSLSVDGEPVPTLDEVLDYCKGRLVLFIELKGATADQQMADDAVKAIRAQGMEDACVLVSLKYDLMDYIEETYPDIHTGFLTFATFGNTSLLNSDYLGLEEESATSDTISAIHRQDKKVLVWTVDEERSQRRFLCSDVEGIITDQVSQAVRIQRNLLQRSDLERMVDRLIGILS